MEKKEGIDAAAVKVAAENEADTEQAGAIPDNLKKQQITLRDGNIAYDIERPLFESEANSIELAKLKEEFLSKLSEAISSLPKPRYL